MRLSVFFIKVMSPEYRFSLSRLCHQSIGFLYQGYVTRVSVFCIKVMSPEYRFSLSRLCHQSIGFLYQGYVKGHLKSDKDTSMREVLAKRSVCACCNISAVRYICELNYLSKLFCVIMTTTQTRTTP